MYIRNGSFGFENQESSSIAQKTRICWTKTCCCYCCWSSIAYQSRLFDEYCSLNIWANAKHTSIEINDSFNQSFYTYREDKKDTHVHCTHTHSLAYACLCVRFHLSLNFNHTFKHFRILWTVSARFECGNRKTIVFSHLFN